MRQSWRKESVFCPGTECSIQWPQLFVSVWKILVITWTPSPEFRGQDFIRLRLSRYNYIWHEYVSAWGLKLSNLTFFPVAESILDLRRKCGIMTVHAGLCFAAELKTDVIPTHLAPSSELYWKSKKWHHGMEEHLFSMIHMEMSWWWE